MDLKLRDAEAHAVTLNEEAIEEPLEVAQARLATDDEDLLDWDVWVEPPPARRLGTVTAKFEYIGRAKPRPVDEP
jgi:hypothetical protein